MRDHAQSSSISGKSAFIRGRGRKRTQDNVREEKLEFAPVCVTYSNSRTRSQSIRRIALCSVLYVVRKWNKALLYGGDVRPLSFVRHQLDIHHAQAKLAGHGTTLCDRLTTSVLFDRCREPVPAVSAQCPIDVMLDLSARRCAEEILISFGVYAFSRTVWPTRRQICHRPACSCHRFASRCLSATSLLSRRFRERMVQISLLVLWQVQKVCARGGARASSRCSYVSEREFSKTSESVLHNLSVPEQAYS